MAPHRCRWKSFEDRLVLRVPVFTDPVSCMVTGGATPVWMEVLRKELREDVRDDLRAELRSFAQTISECVVQTMLYPYALNIALQ